MSVPSSISNSNDRLPVESWGRTWALAICLFAAALGAFEYHFRQLGFRPELADDVGLWCRARGQLRPNDPAAVALLGSSRMQLGMSAEVLADGGSRYPVQLAVTGSLCLPVLEHLSGDPSFVGTVICEVFPGLLAGHTKMPFPSRQAEYVKHYETHSAYEYLETNLRMMVQANCVSRLPELGLWPIGEAIASGQWPAARQATELRSDRCILQDAARLSPEALEHGAPAPAPREHVVNHVDTRELDGTIDRVERMVQRIQSRGGKVVFLRMPSSGRTYAFEEEAFPRASEWDILAARTSARCVHFQDDRNLSNYRCPDGSHLAGRDTAEFTRRVADIVFGNQPAGHP
jgi:hypothetical protein